MLVLSRRIRESIVIGQDIVVTVLEVHRDQVRLGIDAPRDVDVHRLEVFEAIQEANLQAASPSEQSLTALGGLVPSRPTSNDEPDGPDEAASVASPANAAPESPGEPRD